jgi:hypothetical protein
MHRAVQQHPLITMFLFPTIRSIATTFPLLNTARHLTSCARSNHPAEKTRQEKLKHVASSVRSSDNTMCNRTI